MKKILDKVIKVAVLGLLILTFVIHSFIKDSERKKTLEELQLVRAKYDGSIEFIKEYTDLVDSIVQQKDDSIDLLLRQINE